MNCPLCGKDSMPYNKFSMSNISFSVRKCLLCEAMFQADLHKNRDYLYNQEYYTSEAGYYYYDERKNFLAAKAVWDARIKNIRKFIPRGNFLDVGCSFGGLLHSASQFFSSVGLDVSDYAVKEAEKFKGSISKDILQKPAPEIFKGDLLKLPHRSIFRDSNFQVITMIEVAEHLSKPRENFEMAFKLLSKGGLLLIQTANFNGWQAKLQGKKYHYFLPGHLIYYNSDNLKRALKEIGFKKFIEYVPADFGLLPKLVKSRASFHSILDYRRWLRIALYHYISKIRFKGHPLTSSYVLYAFK